MSFVQTLSGTGSWISVCSSLDGSIMYAANSTNIYKSTDKGISWNSIYSTTIINQVICNADGTHVAASTFADSGSGPANGCAYSTNSGGSFTKFNSNLFFTSTANFAITSDVTPRLLGISVGTS